MRLSRGVRDQCRRLIESSGGTLNIDSTVGGGTTIRLTLPVATAPAS